MMTKSQNRSVNAALGGLTATIALLTGLPRINADELADLRAMQTNLRDNQELLQQRIDQLAQTAPKLMRPGEPGPTGMPTLGGSFPRSFLIPGTDTSIRIGGFSDLTVDYWLKGGPANGNATTTVGNSGQLQVVPLNIYGQTVPGFPSPGNVVPVNTAASRGHDFWMSPRESRLNVETRTPTSYGEARTFIEFDFAGANAFSTQNLTQTSNGLIPRLRLAYGTLGGFLAGQAESNFRDSDAEPETLDFGGPAGEAGPPRIPQVRYSLTGPWSSVWSISAESPQTEVITPAGLVTTDFNTASLPSGPGPVTSATTTGCVANGVTISTTTGCTLSGNPAKNTAPDVAFSSYWSQPWGHIDFRGILRNLDFQDGHLISKQYLGYGGGISGDVKPGWFGWEKDDITWQFTLGTGIGRNIYDNTDAALATNYLSPPATAAAARNILVRPITEFGATAGYQHFWRPDLRSTVAYGYAYYDIPSQLIGPTQAIVSNKQLMTVHANVIWSPVAFIDAGLEFLWGQRQVVANIKGSEETLISKFRVKF
ncbi:MAG: porin [Acetobacteraceae bacterium]|nr:porin [Acetobacteraceae bacterium]